jgi:two-component system, NtrC family, response regulator AtoC
MDAKTQQVLELTPESSLILGNSRAIHPINAMIPEIAGTEIPVLLTGESGIGKEVYARWIHRLSKHSNGPFMKVACGTLDSESFLEPVLRNVQSGRNHEEQAAGTLFLDGIEELDLACQRLLLSVLPESGPNEGNGTLRARLLSATSANLEKEIEAGRFRPDLFFRINGAVLRLPPLRKRKDEIPALLDFFLSKYAGESKKQKPAVRPEIMNVLSAHDWPGNIRELENVAKRIVALSDAQLATRDLAKASKGLTRSKLIDPMSLKDAARAALRRTEREMILKALERTHWNRKRAAEELQISYKSFLHKLKQIDTTDSMMTEES